MFTIKSISQEGTYFLVNHWKKNMAFWKLPSEITVNEMFSSVRTAKTSLTKLLKIMEEYHNDQFYIVETNSENRIISETRYFPAILNDIKGGINNYES